MHITGKVALVTGAAGAMGRAIVRHLLENGATSVIALDVNEEALQALKGADTTCLCCDLADAAALEKALLPLLAAQPSVDILINNAGILHSAPLVNIVNKDEGRFAQAASAWERVIGANLSSAFYVTHLVADHMLRTRNKGIIINMSSVSAGGNAGQSAYSASKAGLNALTQVWAKELGPMGIRCVAIAPGYIDTPSTRHALGDAQREAIQRKIPLGHLGDVSHILQGVSFVIENDYLHGTVLEIDGGLCV